MTRHTTYTIGAVAVFALAMLGCNRRADVREQVKELHQAEQAAPEKAQQLQHQLDGAKAQVAQLEQKLALAKQGVTDDVLRERQELKSALRQDERDVNAQVRQAQGSANRHNTDVENAEKALERTQPPGRVETQVRTQTKVTPAEQNTDVVRERQEVPVDQARMVEQQKHQQQQQQPQEQQPQQQK